MPRTTSSKKGKKVNNHRDRGSSTASAILRIFPNASDWTISDSNKPHFREVANSLERLDGVRRLVFNVVTNTLKIEYDPDKLTLEQIRERLGDLSKRNEKS